ncbi:maker17 [Drosophila busckii]|uniref:Maker17 n=2 Tax=Drosophila busckii TaxID=30019 RepID=A0A0M5J294_DROBS|nr:maker17 [Drosophila busckii]
MKCNADPLVLKTLAALGVGFNCASMRELQTAAELGVDADNIIFAHTCKPLSHLSFAAQQNVLLSTFDNEAELYKIKEHLPQSNLVLRFRCDTALNAKFGCDVATEAKALLSLAAKLQLRVVGTSFHVGAACEEPAAYERAIATAKLLYDEGKSLGFAMPLVNLGGGFPGRKAHYFAPIATAINAALAKYFANEPIEIIAEPGRFFVETADTLICKIMGKRVVRHASGEIQCILYYLNDGNSGSFSMSRDYSNIQHFRANADKLDMFQSILWGPTCMSADKIADNIYLPNLNIGELLVFPEMGAYGLSRATEFNGMPLPKMLYYARQTV